MDILRNTILTPDAIIRITDRQGVALNSLKEPTEAEDKTHYELDGEEFSIIVELHDGARGLLFYDEWIYMDSFEYDDREHASYPARKLCEFWFRKIEDILNLDACMSNAQIVPFFGFGTGPFGRMEVGFFIPFDTLEITDLTKKTIHDLWNRTVMGN